MKKLMTMIALLFCCGLIYAAEEKDKKHDIDEVYDLYTPGRATTNIWFWVDGDDVKNRVPLLKGGDPRKKKDDKGKPLLEDDPKDKDCIVRVVGLSNNGGEDNRAFRLHGSVGLSKDKWTKVIIHFIPRRTGKVKFTVHQEGGHRWHDIAGSTEREVFRYPDWGYIDYARFTAKGTRIKDPTTSNSSLGAWGYRADFPTREFAKKIKPDYPTETTGPVGRYLRYPCRELSQKIAVRENEPVVITFYARGGNYYHAKICGNCTYGQ